MSDDAKKKSEPAPAKETEKKEAPAGGGLLSRTPVLLAVVMVLEAGILLAAFMMFRGGPQSAHGAELVEAKVDETGENGAVATANEPPREVLVLEFRAPNKQSGKTFIYDITIFALVKPEHEEKVKKVIDARKQLIQDRVRTIVAQSDPEKLSGGLEPGLETLRRQVKYQLEEIVGEGMIAEVLVPRCIPFRTDF
jgi:flagellar basal body-associated protein FliL